jgi:cardiolipin synthase
MAELVTRDLWRIPGLLSLSRIPLAALFARVSSQPVPAMSVLFFAAVSDVLDGWYARRFHQETPMGRVLDPITDKIFVATVVVSLIASKTLSVGEALLLGTRELCELALVLPLMLKAQTRSRPVRGANHAGKAATLMQFVAVGAILLESPHRRWWLWSTAASGLLAGFVYALREWRTRTQGNAHREPAPREA